MKRLLIPLLAALALPTAVNANVDPKVAEMCMKAVDFQGCVNAMTGVNKNVKNKEELFSNSIESFFPETCGLKSIYATS